MKPRFCCSFLAFTASLFLGVTTSTGSGVTDSAAVKKLFANPPREYATAPLWVWNDMLTEDQVRDTMRDLAGQKVKQVFVHPRPGLMTPYLSPDWFRLWKVALKEAERLDMNVWIYDENSYPSGFAGGWVPELMPESRGRGLVFAETTTPKWSDNTLGIYRLEGGAFTDVSSAVRRGEAAGPGRFVVASVKRAGNSPWHGDRCYVDLMYPGVTEKFLEVTLEAYRREVGHQFGKRVPGSFTDEPELTPAGGKPWTEDLPKQFQKRWGYSLLENLPSLQREVGDWQRVRHNYHQTLLELFIERWAKPYYEYCAKHNLEFTGHYWDHEWPNCNIVPDNMAMAAWQQRPGIDCLMNQYAEHTHAQFGNVRFCREISSVANQLGRKRTLVEIYGAGGWDLRFEDMKRIGDWLVVLGINTLDEHLSYVTLRGARKRDHPQSFSYHEPWWEAYHVNAEYLTRLSCALSQGEQINRVLVLEPTTTAWMHQGTPRLGELGSSFFNLLMDLERAQIEYDLGCEDVLARHGRVEGKKLVVGQRHYDLVVLPPFTENLNTATVQLFETLFRNGGASAILACGAPPAYVDGQKSDRPARASGGADWTRVEAKDLPARLKARQDQGGFVITRAPEDRGILFHHRRQLADGELLLLVNTSLESPSSGTLEAKAGGVEKWDLYSGGAGAYPFEKSGDRVRTKFNLPPSGSLLLFLGRQSLTPVPEPVENWTAIAPSGPMEIRRVEPNVLTLDYVDVRAGGETKANVYFYQANQFAFQKNGMARNPWDSAVQFKDELITKTFPPDSGFEASYRFTIEGAVPGKLWIVIERPDLYRITCNGQPVQARKGQWWLDKAFGKIDLAGVAKSGENVVTIKAAPFTIYHEIEPAYVLGEFTLKSAAKGFVITPDQPLTIKPAREVFGHSVNPDGTAWLSGGIGFATGGGAAATDDRQPFVVFDLGQPRELSAIKIWNYNEAHVRDLTARGTKEFRLSASLDSGSGYVDLGRFTLAQAQGETKPQTFAHKTTTARFVKLEILSNHNGVSYPPSGDVPDNGFVGLAEVRLVGSDGQEVPGVKMAKVSSELAAHKRLARYLVDGSGLVGARPGWNEQGHPFYAAGVAYRLPFNLDRVQGQYRVQLPDWYGSVARVNVNGKLAGYIVAPPWECDVTKQLKRGQNQIEVTVIGTLKNTLGPHHGRQPLGSAWPAMFQNGPKGGQPAGDQYSTVGYGLFAPFAMKNSAAAAK